ncbi:FHA domain-containing protein [Verrucomicrobiota bacterium]
MPRLVSLSPQDEGQTIDLVEDLSVGREPSNSLVLQNKSISAFHCVIEKTSDGWQIRDLMSTNGIFLNAKRVEQGLLRDGDDVKIGKLKYRFELTLASKDSVSPIKSSVNMEPSLPVAAPAKPKPAADAPIEKTIREPHPKKAAADAGYGVSGWSPKGPVSRRRAQKAAAAAKASGKKDKKRKKRDAAEEPEPEPAPAPVAMPFADFEEQDKPTGRASFALMGLMLLALGVFPFLRIDGPALWFWDCFKEENRPAAMLLFTPFAMGFVIWLSALIAKRLYPFVGGLLVLAAVLTTGSLMIKGATPECLTATLQGSDQSADNAAAAPDPANDFVPVTAPPAAAPVADATATNTPSRIRITIPDGATVASAMGMTLLLPEEKVQSWPVPEKIKQWVLGLRLKDLLILQALGLVIMISMCRAAKHGIGAVLCAVGALIGAAIFIGPLFMPLQDGAMLIGKVFTGIGPATFYAPLVLMAVLCLISNVSGVLMLRIALIIFWLGIPICPALTAFLALRSRALVPYLQYVRLLGPLYIVLVLTGWSIGRVILDAGGIPQRICRTIWAGICRGPVFLVKLAWKGIKAGALGVVPLSGKIVPLIKKIKFPSVPDGRKKRRRRRRTDSPATDKAAAPDADKDAPKPAKPAPAADKPAADKPAPAGASADKPAEKPASDTEAKPAPKPEEKPKKAPIKLTIVDD